jgi:peptide/nickel transport system substrate-binding protein
MAGRVIPALGMLLALVAPAAAQPRDTLTIGITQYPATWQPNIEPMAAKAYVEGFTLRPLTAYDADWKLTCLLCETLPSLENGLAQRETMPDGKPGLRLTYIIRQGARWADGQPVTTEDLRFAWEAGRNAETGFGPAEFYRSAYELIIVDARTAILRLDKVTFDYASMGEFQPLPAHLERERWQADPRTYRSHTAYDTDSINPGLWNGPYRVAALTPGASITLDRNDYWNGPAPAFHRITIRTVENTAALEAQLLAGQVDMIAGELGLPVEQAAALERRAGSRFRFAYRPGLSFEHIDVRLDNPLLSDRRVRQALLYGADRAQIVARLFEGKQTVADSMVNPLDGVHAPDIRRYPYDPARANALLDEAGFPRGPDGVRRSAGGERLTVDLMTTAGNRGREAVEQVLQGMWRQLGVETRIRNETPRVFFGETVSHRRYTGLAMYAWVSAPESVPRTTLHSEEIPSAARNWAGQNTTGYRNPEVDALIETLPLELDRDKRRLLWHRLQEIYAEDLPSLPLFFRSDAHIWPLWLQGVRPTGHQDPSSLWVAEWRVR